MGSAIVFLVNAIISLAIWAVIISAVLSWLVAFDVINTRNRAVYQIMTTLDRIISPLLSPIQRIIPPLGGVDISPIILILLLQAVSIAFNRVLAPILIGLML
jgi:YggT family protein